jgi:hypothetical protein
MIRVKASLLVIFSVSASAQITVTAPLAGPVTSPFFLQAAAPICGHQITAAMSYSIDASSTTSFIFAQAINQQVALSVGAHMLHVNAWNSTGLGCAVDIPLNVTPGPMLGSTAAVFGMLNGLTSWKADSDAATSGTAIGATNLASPPSLTQASRQFTTTYSSYGGERYHVTFGPDAVAQNFVYDTYIYLESGATSIANIELDLNQVLSNGATVIYGVQCDGWSKTWDYTTNAGTLTAPIDRWLHSTQSCDPQEWATKVWHHVQMSYSRDAVGNVTYKSVWLDGVEQDLYATVPSAFALGWGQTLLINFQLDGDTSTTSSSVTYLDNTTIYAW